MEKTFRSEFVIGGAIRMEKHVGYWENELLRIYLGKETLDEENSAMANEFVSDGTPWVVYKRCKSGKELAKAFPKFRDAIEYLIMYQEELGRKVDEDFLPNSVEFVD